MNENRQDSQIRLQSSVPRNTFWVAAGGMIVFVITTVIFVSLYISASYSKSTCQDQLDSQKSINEDLKKQNADQQGQITILKNDNLNLTISLNYASGNATYYKNLTDYLNRTIVSQNKTIVAIQEENKWLRISTGGAAAVGLGGAGFSIYEILSVFTLKSTMTALNEALNKQFSIIRELNTSAHNETKILQEQSAIFNNLSKVAVQNSLVLEYMNATIPKVIETLLAQTPFIKNLTNLVDNQTATILSLGGPIINLNETVKIIVETSRNENGAINRQLALIPVMEKLALDQLEVMNDINASSTSINKTLQQESIELAKIGEILKNQTEAINNITIIIKAQTTNITNMNDTLKNINSSLSDLNKTVQLITDATNNVVAIANTQLGLIYQVSNITKDVNTLSQNLNTTIQYINASVQNQSESLKQLSPLLSQINETLNNQNPNLTLLNNTILSLKIALDQQYALVSALNKTLSNVVDALLNQTAIVKSSNETIFNLNNTVTKQLISIQELTNSTKNQSDIIKQQNILIEYLKNNSDNQSQLISQINITTNQMDNSTKVQIPTIMLLRNSTENLTASVDSQATVLNNSNTTINNQTPIIKSLNDITIEQNNILLQLNTALRISGSSCTLLRLYWANSLLAMLDFGVENSGGTVFKYDLVYDTAASPFSRQEFMKAVSKRIWTVSVIFTDIGYAFAGILWAAWPDTEGYIRDPYASTISINNGRSCQIRDQEIEKAVYVNKDVMIQFGQGDFIVYENKTGRAMANATYAMPVPPEGVTNKTFYAGSPQFNVARVQVYQISYPSQNEKSLRFRKMLKEKANSR